MITLSTAELKVALKGCALIAEKRSAIPVISHVKIDVQADGARLAVTDLEVSRRQFLARLPDALTQPEHEPWTAVVPVDALQKLLPKKVADMKRSPTVELSQCDDGRVRVCAASGVSTLRCLPAEDFPTIPTPEASSDVCEPCVFAGDHWRELCRKTIPAISTEESRFQLSGAQFEMNGAARAIATDGHRLHLAEAELRVTSGDQELLIPRQALVAVSKDAAFARLKTRKQIGVYKSGPRKGEPKMATASYSNDVHISSSEHHVWIETAGVRYSSRILEGNFPDFDRVIKKGDAPCVISTTAGDALSAIGAVEHCTGDRARAIRVDLGYVGDDYSGDLPVLSAANPDTGEAEAEMNGRTTMKGCLQVDKPRRPKAGRGKHASELHRAELAKFEEDLKVWNAIGGRESIQHIGVSPDYLSDILRIWPADAEIEIDFWNVNSQVQLRAVADPAARFVVMPIRL